MSRQPFVAVVTAIVFAGPVAAQRAKPVADSATRAAIAEFVTAVRDMAASRIVTPAAHIPVGGLLDSAGHVASVVGATQEPTYTPDTALVSFRQLLGAGARRQGYRAVALGYLVRRAPRQGADSVDAVVVEVEHRNGYRADVIFPYTRNDFGEPIFGDAVTRAGTLHTLSGRMPPATAGAKP